MALLGFPPVIRIAPAAMRCCAFAAAASIGILSSERAVNSLTAGAGSPTGAVAMASMKLVDPVGKQWSNQDFVESDVLVIAFLGTECPLAKLYAPRLQKIIDEVQADSAQSITVLGVFANSQDSLAEIAAMKNAADVHYVFAKDPAGRFAIDTGATRTPEVFVYDRQRTLRYQGQIDDQFGIGYVRDAPTTHSLRDAIEQLIAGQTVSESFIPAPGCLIGFPAQSKSSPTDEPQKTQATSISYHADVQPILQQHCVDCHRSGEIAPFALTDFESAQGWADMMVEVIDQGRMPPWHASAGEVKFANDRSMPEAQKQLIRDWADSGAIEGLEIQRTNDAGSVAAGESDDAIQWELPRKPDLVYSISPDPVPVQASGEVNYRYYSVDPQLDHDVWFDAAQLRPGNREVVHHILCFAVAPDEKIGLEAVNGFLVGYVPGARVETPPAGYAKRLPAHHKLLFQVHYTPIGRETTDDSKLAICLVDEKTVTREIRTASAVQTELSIPPGEPNYVTHAVSSPFPAGAELLSMSPHMHVRGSSYRYELEQPNGQMQLLLDIPQYDFNWQTTYVLRDPIKMNGGERMFCTASFNNSADNLANPDPGDSVRWGDQTWDEMMIGYFHYAVERDSEQEVKFAVPSKFRAMARYKRFNELDQDNDGQIERGDAPLLVREIFDEMDADRDQIVTRREAVLYRD